MSQKQKVLIVGLGNMGTSHANVYHKLDGFEIVGLMSRGMRQRQDIPAELESYPRFDNFEQAMSDAQPDAVSISTWPNTHAQYALAALNAGCHVFMEKPIATNIKDANEVVAAARRNKRKLVLGYILRVHPSWIKFIKIGKTLGKPLVMRFNLNQQSNGTAWSWHKDLIDSLIPIVDCGVHYVDVMCQLTGARPVRVHGIGAKLWEAASQQNYGHMHVTFDDGSVGWYEAGWGPMMSEVAYFVKDIVGPKGSVSMIEPSGTDQTNGNDVSNSADIDKHTKTDILKVHNAAVDQEKNFKNQDQLIAMPDEPNHQELCELEQQYFLRAIQEDLDLSASMQAAVDSLRIVLAAEESIESLQAVHLD